MGAVDDVGFAFDELADGLGVMPGRVLEAGEGGFYCGGSPGIWISMTLGVVGPLVKASRGM